MTEHPEPKATGGPVEPSRYTFADPNPGCVFFIPRRANAERSKAILEHARAWYWREGEATE